MTMGVRALFRVEDTNSDALLDFQSRIDQLGGWQGDRWTARCSVHKLETGTSFRKLYVINLPGDLQHVHLSIDGTTMRSDGPKMDDFLHKIGIARPRVSMSSSGVSYKLGDFWIRAGPLSVNEVLKAHVLEIEYCPCSTISKVDQRIFEELAAMLCPGARLCSTTSNRLAVSSDEHCINQHVQLLGLILDNAERDL